MSPVSSQDHSKESSPKRGRPRDPRRRAAIIAAGRTLFLEHGLQPVSMDAVAELAGVSKKTVYSYFTDKQALFEAVVFSEASDFQPVPTLPPPKDVKELRQRLIRYGESLLHLLTQPSILDLGRLLLSESRRHPEMIERFYSWGPQASHRHLSSVIHEANALGLISAPSPEVVADQLACMWQGMRHGRQQLGLCPPPSSDEIRETVTSAVDVILRAYACVDPARRNTKKA